MLPSGFHRIRHCGLIANNARKENLALARELLVMNASAIFLNIKAADSAFDTWFYAVQVRELAAGVVQLTFLGKNFLAGLRLSGRLRTTPAK